MDVQRLDLSPNRWMAAGGLAFINVRVWKGWLAQISVAPVRDVIVGRATLFGLPHRPCTNAWLAAIVLIGVLCFPEIVFWLFGSVKGKVDWTAGIIVVSVPVAILLSRVWRRGKLGIFLSDEQPDFLNRTYFSDTQANNPDVLTFCDHLTALKADVGDGKRMARTYILLPRSVSIVFAVMFTLLVGIAMHYRLAVNGVNHPEMYGALAAFLVSGIILLLSPRLSEVFNGDLHRAHSCLLAGDAESAANIHQSILDAKPKLRYANYLMTVTRLMQGDLECAEDIVIVYRTSGLYKPSLYHRIMDYNLWESRHGDH